MANVHHPGTQEKDANVALKYLKEGNERFVKGDLHKWDHAEARKVVSTQGQKPFAVVLTCADSRTPPETYFDQGIGNIFVVRNAGNFPDPTALGSIEFGAKHLGAAVIAVVGHNQCGAVITAHSEATGLSDNLQNALDTIGAGVKGKANEEEAMCANIDVSVDIIKNNPVIKEVGTKVVGAVYDIGTGEVKFLD